MPPPYTDTERLDKLLAILVQTGSIRWVGGAARDVLDANLALDEQARAAVDAIERGLRPPTWTEGPFSVSLPDSWEPGQVVIVRVAPLDLAVGAETPARTHSAGKACSDP